MEKMTVFFLLAIKGCMYHFSEGTLSNPRKAILHNIDPLFKPLGHKLPKSPFDNRVRAAIRIGDWKLITGSPGTASPHYLM